MSAHLMKWLNSPLPLQSLYFVVGTEAFFVSEIKKTFINNIFSDPSAKDFNFDEIYANETSTGDLLSLLETLPLMAEKRLVFCHKAESFHNTDWEQLSPALIQKRNKSVLVCFFEKKDDRKKHFKNLKNHAVALSAEPVRQWDLEPWLDFLAQKMGLSFSVDSKKLFCELAGGNLMEIQLELKKLKHYMGDNNHITEKDVIACVSRLNTDSIFDLCSAIGRKNIPQAFKALADVLAQNQSEAGALALTARHIRILSRLQKGKKQKLNRSNLARQAGVPPYFLKDYLNQARLWSESQIHQTIKILYETDKAIKSSPLPAHIWLESFILKVCS